MMFFKINRDKNYVKQIQKEVGVKPDGIAGKNTLKAIEEAWGCNVLQINGKFVPIQFHGKVRHDKSLDKNAAGASNWYMRKTPVDNIVVHWGGLHNDHCFRVFFSEHNTGKTTSHFLIGRNVENNELEVWQCLDTGMVAYHAGKMNKQSVGLDICMHPDPKYASKTSEWYNTEVIDNPGRGPKQCMAIDEELAEFAQEFLAILRDVLELQDKPVCLDDEVYDLEDVKQFSIVGHHNVSARKWDCSPWKEKLYGDLDSEDYNC